MGIGVSVTFDELYIPREAAAHGLSIRVEAFDPAIHSPRGRDHLWFFFFGHDATGVEGKVFNVYKYSERSIFLVGRRIFATSSLLFLISIYPLDSNPELCGILFGVVEGHAYGSVPVRGNVDHTWEVVRGRWKVAPVGLTGSCTVSIPR